MTIRPSTDRTDSPTWDELDAICKGKSAMDLAEEIWRLRRDGPKGELVAKWNDSIQRGLRHEFFKDGLDADLSGFDVATAYAEGWRDAWLTSADDLSDATRHQLVEGEVETVKDVYRKWGKDDVR